MSLGNLALENDLKSAIRGPLSLDANFRLEALPGDASNRRYLRLHWPNSETRILMLINAPEAFKSEEITGAEKEAKTSELDFVRVARAWGEKSIRVPRIDYVDPQNRFLICEDFGEELLYERRQKEPAVEFYKKALEALVQIQSLPNEFPYKKGAFTQELLAWEFHHFYEYALEKRGISLSAGENKLLKSFFDKTLNELSKIPSCVVHRDFHSKNLMILPESGNIGLIDFQDALEGPEVYDIASLLRDSYVQFSEKEEIELFSYFNSIRKNEISYEGYSRMSLQRNMKAVGRFFYISMVKKKDTHLPYVSPSLQRISKTLKDIGESDVLDLLHSKMEKDF